jgi:hypothetical protein
MPRLHRPSADAAQAALSVDRLAEWIDQTVGADLDVRNVQVMLACAFLQLGCPAILSITEIAYAWRTYYRHLTPMPDAVYSRNDIRRGIAELVRRGVLGADGGLSIASYTMRWRGMH